MSPSRPALGPPKARLAGLRSAAARQFAHAGCLRIDERALVIVLLGRYSSHDWRRLALTSGSHAWLDGRGLGSGIKNTRRVPGSRFSVPRTAKLKQECERNSTLVPRPSRMETSFALKLRNLRHFFLSFLFEAAVARRRRFASSTCHPAVGALRTVPQRATQCTTQRHAAAQRRGGHSYSGGGGPQAYSALFCDSHTRYGPACPACPAPLAATLFFL